MIIYKYSPISDKVLDNLKKGNLMFRSPNQFEDHMDSNLPVKENDINEIVEKYKSDLNKIDIDLLKQMTPPPGFFEKIRSQSNSDSLESMLQDYKEDFVGITCFTKREDNTEMWKEYGDNNQGICLCFETDLDSDFFKDLTEVPYEEELPKIDYLSNDLTSELKKNFSIKQREDYEFEEELRLLKHNPSLQSYQKGSLRKIVFGSKISLENESIIRTIVTENYNSRVELYKSKT